MLATDALVIRSVKYGEHDVLLTLLTADRGPMFVCAKGGRSLKSEQLALSQLFTYANMEIYEKNGRFWLKGGSVIQSFYKISDHIESLAVASYMAETVRDFTAEGEPCPSELQLLLNMLYALDKGIRNPALIKAVWEIRLSCISGYAPDLDRCAGCGSENAGFLDLEDGHLLCQDCADRLLLRQGPDGIMVYVHQTVSVKRGALSALKYVSSASPKKLLSFELTDPEEIANFCAVCEAFFLYHVGHGYTSLDFCHDISHVQ